MILYGKKKKAYWKVNPLYIFWLEFAARPKDTIIKYDDYLNKYKNQLKEYFNHVVEVGVSRDRKLKPKQSEYKKYFLILCTNNPSAVSLAGYQLEKIEIQMRDDIADMNTFIYRGN